MIASQWWNLSVGNDLDLDFDEFFCNNLHNQESHDQLFILPEELKYEKKREKICVKFSRTSQAIWIINKLHLSF